MIAFFLVGLFLWGGIGAQAADVSTYVLGAKKQTLSASTDAVNAGYYSATWLSNIDANLSEPNIKSGVSIFGKSGTFTIVLPKTGQTTVIHPATPPYDLGDDGVLQKGFSGTRFLDNGNYTVTDNATQLMWQKCSISDSPPDENCSSGAGIYPWDEPGETADAFTKVAELNQSGFAGYADWRLPNVKELQSIVDYGQEWAAIDAGAFPNTAASAYWTASTLLSQGYQWLVDFLDGSVYDTNSSMASGGYYAVRAVRGP